MAQDTTNNDQLFNGTVTAKGLYSNQATITDAMIAANAAIAGSKIRRREVQLFTQPNGSAATTVRQVIATCRGVTGSIIAFRAGVVTACIGAATISIRLKKNGSNIDTAALVLDNANAAFNIEAAAGFTSTVLAANDVLEIDVTATAGGGTLGQGLFCELTTDEDAA